MDPIISDCLWEYPKNSPNATLAEVASWLIQKLTQLSITIKMLGKYVWNIK